MSGATPGAGSPAVDRPGSGATPGAGSPAVDRPYADLPERLAAVRRRIEAVARGRQVEIIAVTKGFGPEAVDAAVAAGLTAVGENYAQELLAKAAVGAGRDAVRWHFIGGIQRNKVATLAPHVGLWHTVDRPSLVDAIAGHAPGAPVLVQVNVTGDPARPGAAWEDVGALVSRGRDAGLDVRGLMAVGPAGDPEQARPKFAELAALAGRLGLSELSMGMTDDLEVAVAEGSTIVRVGTALFGPRPQRADLRR
ncbi:MAG: YggS family pyridoxal phosphate-dependent enzyme [Acidimicrobiales bacterium]